MCSVYKSIKDPQQLTLPSRIFCESVSNKYRNFNFKYVGAYPQLCSGIIGC